MKAIRIFLSTLLVLAFHIGHSNISLPAIFNDNMVIQQNTQVKFWGWGKPNEQIRIIASWSSDTLKIKVGNQAYWEIATTTPKAGGPYQINFQGYNQILLNNVMLGEVWLCSGQSNMEWSANSGIDNGKEEIAKADNPNIRLFSAHHRTANTPQVDLEGNWVESTPETMRSFSAIAYFFAKKINEETGVPIGMINSSWGGTPAEIWMPADVIENNEYLLGASKKLRAAPWGPHEPGRAYNTMIAPLRNFKIAGALWYQGEGNAANAMEYKDMFSTLITSWREQWGYEFPFYYVQIAPYKYGEGNRGTLVRDAQRRTLEVPNTGMVVVSDIGNTQNIHPSNKIDIGYRMANLALSNYYKTTDVVSSGPLYKGREIEKAKVRVLFDNAVGLNVKGKEITHFEIAGENKIYYPAKAKIDGSSVVVQAKEVKNPAFVRFAWDNVAEPNLFNSAGLPTSCFTSEN